MESQLKNGKFQLLDKSKEDHLIVNSTNSFEKPRTKNKRNLKQPSKGSNIPHSEESCVANNTLHKSETVEHNTKMKVARSTIKREIETDVVGNTKPKEDLTSGEVVEVLTTIEQAENSGGDKRKMKSKKNKRTAADKQNISMKSSFSKFESLQKRNLIHVRSSDAGKAQTKFASSQDEKDINCRICSKPVYKMEEIKAEKSVFHKNCFRCSECNKQLSVDHYQSNEGVLYCGAHFKMLFVPKAVENIEPEEQSKPELIIRENQPLDLPPDVIRASDKPDLGLAELQQLNVRSRFQVFENNITSEKGEDERMSNGARHEVKHSTSILSKLAKLQAQGVAVSTVGDFKDYNNSRSYCQPDSDGDQKDSDEDFDLDLIQSKKEVQRELPVGLGHVMNDIKNKFEKGVMSKEERREERKQEIQHIRSRLFMGKQARIKEMYQQAVAESEQAITSSGKQPDVEFAPATRLIKERFEKGEIFKDTVSENKNESQTRTGSHIERDVFESGISKQSRSIFMELDANTSAARIEGSPFKSSKVPETHCNTLSAAKGGRFENEEETLSTDQRNNDNIVKSDEKIEDIEIKTSEISSKFKFFETYRPIQSQKKEFRITPPREGVVKMPTPDTDAEPQLNDDDDYENIVRKSQTTSTMLSKFRELENKTNYANELGPKPLKCFTPPPENEIHVYKDESSCDSQEEDESDSYEDYEVDNSDKESCSKYSIQDEALKEAQAAARAKYLRAKFEKWEANEALRELNDGLNDIYSQKVSDNTTIESTKTLRERFEKMKESQSTASSRPRYQVNRFV